MSIPLFDINIVTCLLSFNQLEKNATVYSFISFLILSVYFFLGASKISEIQNDYAPSTKTLILSAASSRRAAELRAKRG